MKNTRSCLRLLAATALLLAASPALSERKTSSVSTVSERSQLATRLYRQHHQPTAENFGRCLGSYVRPAHLAIGQAVSDDSFVGNNQRRITAELDRLTGTRDGLVRLRGNVVINDGVRVLEAAEALFNQSEQGLIFPQGLVVSERNLVIQSERADIGFDGQEMQLASVQWLLPQQGLRGTAELLQQTGSGEVVLTDATLTRCAPGNDGWSLGVKSLKINEARGYAQAKGALLRVKSTPVAYLPQMRVSLDGAQTSGWQSPSGGFSSRDGLDLQLPYFWKITPQSDATLTPRWISRRGVGIDGQARYGGSRQEAEINLSYLPSDNLYNGYFDRQTYKALGGENRIGSFESADRWLMALSQRGDFGPINTRIDFARSSDRDFFRDLNSYVGLTNPNALNQLAEVAFTTAKLKLKLRSLGFQRIDELYLSDYRSSPALLLDYESNAYGQGMNIALNVHWSGFDAQQGRLDAMQSAPVQPEGRRAYISPTLAYRRDYAGGYWSVKGGYKFTRYDLDDNLGLVESGDRQIDRGVGFFSADTGLFFERDLKIGGGDLVQTLEPRLYYLKQGYEAQDSLPVFDAIPLNMTFDDLFSDSRFAGFDRIGDADRVTLAATSRLLAPTGRELIAVSLAYLDHLSAPRVRWQNRQGRLDIGASDLLASEQTLSLNDAWQFRARQLWNNERSVWEELGASLHLRGSGRRVYNFGVNRRTRDQITQAEFSTYAPLSQHLAFTTRWHYDLESHRTLEAFVGFEYDDCCIRLRAVARQYLENPSYRNFGLHPSLLPLDELRTDRGLMLEVQLKGLAEFGSKVDALLRRSVYGYAQTGLSR